MLYFISAVFLGSVVMAGLSESLLARFFFLSFAALFIITVGAKYLYTLSLETLKNEQKRQQLIRSGKDGNDKKSKSKPKYNTKVIDDENYKKLTQTIKYFSQNKVLDRKQILAFKEEINERLGDHVKYYKNNWENDLHEIYSKLKSKKLGTEEYIELLEVLKSYNN